MHYISNYHANYANSLTDSHITKNHVFLLIGKLFDFGQPFNNKFMQNLQNCLVCSGLRGLSIFVRYRTVVAKKLRA